MVITAALAALGFGMLAASAAASLPPVSAESGSLLLRSDPPGTVHVLAPGSPALWNIGVTVRQMPASTLDGVVTAHGAVTSTGAAVPVDIEILGCLTPWNGASCDSTPRVIVPRVVSGSLPTMPAALTDPARSIPANVWVQVRATMAADAPQASAGTITVRLEVQASGDGARAKPGTPSNLANTGTPAAGAALLAVAAIGGGLSLVSLVRARRHDE